MVEALTDVVVAIMIAFVVYAIGLRLTAENFSQRLLTHWSPGGALGLHSSDKASTWAFVDIGPAICRSGSIHQGLCPPATLVTDDKTLADLVHDVRNRNPRVVVLDISSAGPVDGLSSIPAFPGVNLANELARSGPPVLIAWSVDPWKLHANPGGMATVDLSDSQANALTAQMPHVRYLPALVNAGSRDSFLLPAFKYLTISREGVVPSLSHPLIFSPVIPRQ